MGGEEGSGRSVYASGACCRIGQARTRQVGMHPESSLWLLFPLQSVTPPLLPPPDLERVQGVWREPRKGLTQQWGLFVRRGAASA